MCTQKLEFDIFFCSDTMLVSKPQPLKTRRKINQYLAPMRRQRLVSPWKPGKHHVFEFIQQFILSLDRHNDHHNKYIAAITPCHSDLHNDPNATNQKLEIECVKTTISQSEENTRTIFHVKKKCSIRLPKV